MGQPNRVEELEQRVRELEATVTGLTDELLECKQQLETLSEASEEVDTPNRSAPKSQEETESEEGDGDSEIIVA